MRADSTYEGKPRIDRFFRVERLIRGIHRIEDMRAFDNQVFCRGEFTGVGAKGDARQVKFVDLWFFGKDGRVQRRETCLASGHEWVKA